MFFAGTSTPVFTSKESTIIRYTDWVLASARSQAGLSCGLRRGGRRCPNLGLPIKMEGVLVGLEEPRRITVFFTLAVGDFGIHHFVRMDSAQDRYRPALIAALNYFRATAYVPAYPIEIVDGKTLEECAEKVSDAFLRHLKIAHIDEADLERIHEAYEEGGDECEDAVRALGFTADVGYAVSYYNDAMQKMYADFREPVPADWLNRFFYSEEELEHAEEQHGIVFTRLRRMMGLH